MSKFCTQCGHQTKVGNRYKLSKDNSIKEVKKGKSSVIVPFIIILLLIGIPILYYWSTISTPEKTLKQFENSYNNLDTDGMFDCLDPSVRTIYKGTMALISGFIDNDADAIFKGIIGVYKVAKDGKTQRVKFKIHNVNYTSPTTAVVEVTVHYDYGEINEEETTSISMKKVEKRWYLKMY